MDLEVVELSERRAELIIEDVDHSVVNALRRTLISDVPKLAVEDVTIYDNTSALFDEIIGHRLGLLPIPTDLETFGGVREFLERDPAEDDEEEGVAMDQVLFTLSKEGPGTVYAEDLKPTDPAYTVADPKVPIVKLREGQRLMLEATARLGAGSEHGKWNPVNGAGYKEYPTIELKGEPPLLPSTVTALRKVAPPGSVEFTEDGSIEVLDLEKAYDFLRTAKDLHDLENVEVGFEPNKFIFRFETDGSLEARDALVAAVDVLLWKLEAVEARVPELDEAEAPAA